MIHLVQTSPIFVSEITSLAFTQFIYRLGFYLREWLGSIVIDLLLYKAGGVLGIPCR